MLTFKVFAVVYLLIGFAYSMYLFFRAKCTLFEIPVNTLGGPIVIVYAFVKMFRGDRY